MGVIRTRIIVNYKTKEFLELINNKNNIHIVYDHLKKSSVSVCSLNFYSWIARSLP